VPLTLISDYSFNHIPIVNWGNPGTLASLAIYSFLIFVAIKNFKRKNLLSFSILYFLITFSIVSNIIFLVGATLAERFLYTPSLGFCIAAAFLLSKLNKKTSVAAMLMVTLLYSVKTIARNNDWKSNYTLFSKDIESAPKSCKLNYYYSVAILDEVQLSYSPEPLRKEAAADKAIAALKRALTIMPHFIEAMEQMGYAYYVKGDFENAKRNYAIAAQHGSPSAKLLNNYAVAYIETNEPEKAVPMLEKALAQNPNYVEASNNLGSAYNRLGYWDKAVQVLQKAIKINPRYGVAYKNIARAYGNLRQWDTALDYVSKAEQLIPGDPEVYMLKGYSYHYKGNRQAAEAASVEYARLTGKKINY
jgi:tetratricopeptide (TPR) repeat protein